MYPTAPPYATPLITMASVRNEVLTKNRRSYNKVRSSEIRKSLNIEPLLLQIERSQLRWFGHVSRMPQERLPKQALLAKANGRRPIGRPRTRWTDYIKDLGWNSTGLHPSEMMEVMEVVMEFSRPVSGLETVSRHIFESLVSVLPQT